MFQRVFSADEQSPPACPAYENQTPDGIFHQLRINHDRRRAIVHQLHLHIRAKFTGLDRQTQISRKPVHAHANPPHFSIFSFTNIKKSGKYFGSSQFFVHGLAALSKAQLKS